MHGGRPHAPPMPAYLFGPRPAPPPLTCAAAAASLLAAGSAGYVEQSGLECSFVPTLQTEGGCVQRPGVLSVGMLLHGVGVSGGVCTVLSKGSTVCPESYRTQPHSYRARCMNGALGMGAQWRCCYCPTATAITS